VLEPDKQKRLKKPNKQWDGPLFRGTVPLKSLKGLSPWTVPFARAVFVIGILSGCLLAQATFKDQQNLYPRVRQARVNRQPAIDSFFNEAGISYPPRRILIVAFKHEQSLQLWAKPDRQESFQLIKAYPFTAFSGALGPKRRQGDLQVPEGFYEITYFYPESPFHLALLVSYPNASDRILGYQPSLGGDICIHGNAVTIGCIPIGDAAIEELYIMCVDQKSAGRGIPVYIFPCAMDSSGMADLKALAASDIGLYAFWENLKAGYNLFTNSFRELKYRVDEKGRYVFTP
jgi:murein L,D-transpeptidase YafK